MNLRGNKKLMIGGGICAAVLIVEVAVLAFGGVRLSQAKKAVKQERVRLTRLFKRNPFPSAENVQVLEKNLDELEYRIGAITAEMIRDPFPRDAIDAAEFSARAQDVIERFRERAEQSGMVLPDSLEVGFAKYASGGAVPQVSHVPRLMRQLHSVERVADVLVKNGVASVDKLSRDLFEASVGPEIPQRRRPRNTPASGARKPLSLVASESGPDGSYYIERIGVSFSAKEAVVWRVLDGFAASPHVMVITEFAHQTRSGILDYSPEAVKAGGDDETLRFLSEGILSGARALSRPERIIAGDELVEVRLMVDVYNFQPGEAMR
ncbi:Amuc_1100 family pilus-like protein [Pontiellaceae bacterium B12227]|nr:Amuc_1100 family pilus-like protein [Pontiellaceae bacterium B12227]